MKNIIIFESRFGDAKLRDENGYRKDTVPLIKAFLDLGWSRIRGQGQ